MQEKLSDRKVAYALVAIAVVTCITLVLMGRLWWCEVGDYSPWSWDIWSSHNSQHLLESLFVVTFPAWYWLIAATGSFAVVVGFQSKRAP